MNDKIAKFAYDQGRADALEEDTKASKNIDMSTRKKPENTRSGVARPSAIKHKKMAMEVTTSGKTRVAKSASPASDMAKTRAMGSLVRATVPKAPATARVARA